MLLASVKLASARVEEEDEEEEEEELDEGEQLVCKRRQAGQFCQDKQRELAQRAGAKCA